MKYCKWYSLTNKDYKDIVDLRLYENDIEKAVHKVKPDAAVIVDRNAFCIIPPLTRKKEIIRISQDIRSDKLKEFTYYRPSLFESHEAPVPVSDNDNSTDKASLSIFRYCRH